MDKRKTALPGYYTTKEAAEKLGYATTATLAKFCSSGLIVGAVKVGKTWFIPEAWVLEQEKIKPMGKGRRGVIRK